MNESSKFNAKVVHGVALGALGIVMALQVITDLTMKVKITNIRSPSAELAVVVWCFLIWKI